MTVSLPQLVVTLPARDPVDARRQAAAARLAGADLAEVRLDRWSPGARERVGDLFPSPLPLVGTVRSRAEGGEGPDDRRARAAILSALARLPFAYLDRERARDPIPPQRAGEEPLTIESSHLAAGTPVAAAREIWASSKASDVLRKVVLPATVGVALGEILPLFESGDVPRGTSVMTTGPSGPLLRALAPRLGAALVYARLSEDTAGDAAPFEPSQLPVGDLRRFFAGGADAPLFALLGRPVAHSMSPRLHGEWMRRAGAAGLYVPLEIGSEEELAVAVRHLPALGFRGTNVTHPWKEAALRLVPRASAAARDCGAANCLRFDPDGPTAENTDVEAIERRLRELTAAGRWAGGEVAVLGTGGAARATVVAARRVGARVTVYGRRPDAVERLVRALGAGRGDLAAPRPAPLVVHATSVGRGGSGALELPLSALIVRGGYVLDWVYGVADGEVARAAARGGAEYESGEQLLAYQAASSYEHWWGAPPPSAGAGTSAREATCAE